MQLEKPGSQLATPGNNRIDARTKSEVIQDLATMGVLASPNIHPQHLLTDPDVRDGLPIQGERLFPLGNISHRLSVQKNEGGYWLSYKTDRYGFHNNDKNWDHDIDLIILGDSYAEGWAVRSKDNVAAVLSSKGLQVINLGKAGNGPLLEYASLVEYGLEHNPKVALWLYFENDIENDLLWEWRSSLLRRYLEPNFSQNLSTKQALVDQVMIERIEKLKKERHQDPLSLPTQTIKPISSQDHFRHFSAPRVLKLANLRAILKLTPNDVIRKTLFRDLISSAKSKLDDRRTKFYFVYLPAGNVIQNGGNHSWRSFVLNTVQSAGITTIDAQEEVFEGVPNINAFFPFGDVLNHYNEAGYRLLAERIWYRIGQDFDQFLD